MFFALSKIVWWFAGPGNLLLILVLATAVLAFTPWRRWSRRIALLTALFALFVAVLPTGTWMFRVLEDRFPVPAALPERIDGIVTLGGVVDQFVTRDRGQAALSGSVERLTEFAFLAQRHPEAKLIFTGGSGQLLHQELGEAAVVPPLLAALGVDPTRVLFEGKSRNTAENATLSKALAEPKPGENWVLITSAFHMPRAVGCFRKAGWTVIPYPVDFSTTGQETFGLSFNLIGGLGRLDAGLHEWIGLAAYWITDRTNSLFPAPAG